jgi:hypothetical protein
MELWRVVESGDVEALACLLPRVANINARNHHGMTVLMKAASCGHAQVVRLLLEHGADPNLTRNDKFTALALAAFFGHTETVKTLMEFGARTETVTRSGASAHTWATARTFADVARCLDTPDTPGLKTQARLSGPTPLRPSRNRVLALGVIASLVLIVCFGLGALVLSSSEARDLPPKSLPPPAKVENTLVTNQAEPPEPNPVVKEAAAESSAVKQIRPTFKKVSAPSREVTTVKVLSEKPVEKPVEKIQISEPPVVAKPKFDSPKPPALSPQIIAPSKKAKVIQWP